jgi:hypothetical protein
MEKKSKTTTTEMMKKLEKKGDFLMTGKASDFPDLKLPPGHGLNDEQLAALEQMTKYIHVAKVPRMPFTRMDKYLEAYNRIQMKQANELTATQRMVVKNVIHSQARIGKITLTIQKNDDN